MKLVLLIIMVLVLSDIGVAQFNRSEAFKNQFESGIQSGDISADLKVLCIKRKWPDKKGHESKALLRFLGFPSNHECHSSLRLKGYENEIGIIDIESGTYSPLYKPQSGFFVGQIDLHWNADKLLFTETDNKSWKIFEMNIDGTGKRQVSQTPHDVDCFESCYLPDGRIIFNSNAPMQCVPCWHGVADKYVANLYRMNADGSEMRRLCFDQDHDFHPSVRNNGQVVYSRWDYTGINRLFLRPVMTMNPDGTGQKGLYGSNTWFPNGFYYPQELPGNTGKFLGIVAGYHGSWRSGKLAVLDVNDGKNKNAGITQIHGKWEYLEPEIKDRWSWKSWPEFLTPSCISSNFYLSSVWEREEDEKIGIYLADNQNNINLLYEEEGFAFLEPIPIQKRKIPPLVPDRINLDDTKTSVYIQDIYEGPGLKGVPRGVVKDIRVISYDFGYIGMAGVDKIGLSGPWEAMRILGTTPVEKDGSAIFKIPANTPVAFQALDENGNAVQLMRSWVTGMPGEVMSCVGCHEDQETVPLPKVSIASRKTPMNLKEWFGPERGFDFAREVQPVLNRYCISCHNQNHQLDFRPEEQVDAYTGRYPGRLDFKRLHPSHVAKYNNKVLYTPAYEALLPYIRRVNAGDDVSMLEPGEYHVNTSELVQLIKEGHNGIVMDQESMQRITAWIDMNGPCHGTWNDVYNEPIPGNYNQRRWELAEDYGGPQVIPDVIPEPYDYDETPVAFEVPKKTKKNREALNDIPALKFKTIDLGNGEQIELVDFNDGYWMGTCEISNAQFRRFNKEHNSRYFSKRHPENLNAEGKGLDLNGDQQPALRVSWNEAMDYCKWLSEKTGMNVSLPTQKQWEKACLAGSAGEYYFNGEDFSDYENFADSTFASYGFKGQSIHGHFVVAGDSDMVSSEGKDLSNKTINDGVCVTAPVGSFRSNNFGLFDMHGNAAEWVLDTSNNKEKIVKGGSYLDCPERCSVDMAHTYPAWQKVHNVGFRIVVTAK